MALQLKQSLSLSQQLIMTPQLQQAIKLLQLSRLELLETISQEMETNPLLDEQQSENVEGENDFYEEVVETIPEITPEVRVEENLIRPDQDMDWDSYLSEYNTGWADTPHEKQGTSCF